MDLSSKPHCLKNEWLHAEILWPMMCIHLNYGLPKLCIHPVKQTWITSQHLIWERIWHLEYSQRRSCAISSLLLPNEVHFLTFACTTQFVPKHFWKCLYLPLSHYCRPYWINEYHVKRSFFCFFFFFFVSPEATFHIDHIVLVSLRKIFIVWQQVKLCTVK